MQLEARHADQHSVARLMTQGSVPVVFHDNESKCVLGNFTISKEANFKLDKKGFLVYMGQTTQDFDAFFSFNLPPSANVGELQSYVCVNEFKGLAPGYACALANIDTKQTQQVVVADIVTLKPRDRVCLGSTLKGKHQTVLYVNLFGKLILSTK